MSKKTATIDAHFTGCTLINVYEVDAAKQDELVRSLSEATEQRIRHLPGFISVSIHRSLDGTRVVNYAQWASKEHLDRMLNDPDARVQLGRFAALAQRVSPMVYTVAAVHSA